MWFIWNKTCFGKNMFACGSNPEAANVSGVNVAKNTMMVFILAGIMYSITGFIEAARIGSNSPSTGQNYELDAIAACVIGGVSFVGGIGSIGGIIVGVLLLRIIFVGLTVLSVSANWQYIIKGLIILIACAIDVYKRQGPGGIGIKNVSDRIRIYFGAPYGLSIQSEPDQGTRVIIRLPQSGGNAHENP